MTERAQNVMNAIWESRNHGIDTENKLTAAILRIVSENVTQYNAQNDLIVMDPEYASTKIVKQSGTVQKPKVPKRFRNI